MTEMVQALASLCRTHDLKEKACLAEVKGGNRFTYPDSQYTSCVKNTWNHKNTQYLTTLT